MNKELKKRASKVGRKLYDLAENLEELYENIDLGPELDDKGFKKLLILENVQALVEIAGNLYPYHEE